MSQSSCPSDGRPKLYAMKVLKKEKCGTQEKSAGTHADRAERA